MPKRKWNEDSFTVSRFSYFLYLMHRSLVPDIWSENPGFLGFFSRKNPRISSLRSSSIKCPLPWNTHSATQDFSFPTLLGFHSFLVWEKMMEGHP